MQTPHTWYTCIELKAIWFIGFIGFIFTYFIHRAINIFMVPTNYLLVNCTRFYNCFFLYSCSIPILTSTSKHFSCNKFVLMEYEAIINCWFQLSGGWDRRICVWDLEAGRSALIYSTSILQFCHNISGFIFMFFIKHHR